MNEREAPLPEQIDPSHTVVLPPESALPPLDRERARSAAGCHGPMTTEATEAADIDLTSREPAGALADNISMLEPGQLLGIYRLVRRVDSGSMGVVYEAIDTERAARVALKTLQRFEPRGLYRLKHEFRQIADVYHPNLVHLHELLGWQGILVFHHGLHRGR